MPPIPGSPQAKPRGRSPGDTRGFSELKSTLPKGPTDSPGMSTVPDACVLLDPALFSPTGAGPVRTPLALSHGPAAIALTVNGLLHPLFSPRKEAMPPFSPRSLPSRTPLSQMHSPHGPGEASTDPGAQHPEQEAWARRA